MGDRSSDTDLMSRDSDRGFTLIETLVAISILAISLVVILQLFSGGLKSSTIIGRIYPWHIPCERKDG